MSNRIPLNDEQLKNAIQDLQGWVVKDGAIEKKFIFPNFADALSFIVRIGIEAEKKDHHPELKNIYNQVTLRWNTHDVKGITSLDFELAAQCDTAFVQFSKK